MVHLAIIFHMHQPYYKDLLTQESEMPWVRLHGTKDYLDMLQMLEKFPAISLTINLVPSLLEQIEDYQNKKVKDKYFTLSLKDARELTPEEKSFILENFFHINKERILSLFPRYYELFRKKQARQEFTSQDYLDLQVLFNLAWIDPLFRHGIPELADITLKARFFCEKDKQIVLDKQLQILKNIIPAYKKAVSNGKIEITVTPYYHPILPLLYNTSIAKEANPKTTLPKIKFSYPPDAKTQIKDAVAFYKSRFGKYPSGMWPSEESVSEHITDYFTESKINWIVTDEAILFKSIGRKKRDTDLLYRPHYLKTKRGKLNIIFRDRNLSDLIGFEYHKMKTEAAVADFMQHMQNIDAAFKKEDVLVAIAMDGENAWEFYPNDGHDFLELLYKKLSESDFIRTTTIRDYLKNHPAQFELKRLAAGSWIYAEFGKWIGNPYKVKAWEWLARARGELEEVKNKLPRQKRLLAWKQMYILEGSDWFWWYGEDPHGGFDSLYRRHLTNFYHIIGKEAPDYLKSPLVP